ncbi:MAG: FAD-dependent oxidoreductase [Lachnospiraceae bacterium]|nr:FAD-dependent oxidoreductase [Lachnospiraceae bacterium]
MESLWRQQTKEIQGNLKRLNKKPDRITWDVIVIGAGMAGMLTAFYLKESGKKVLVLEAKTIGSGQTERTTAKITSQHGIKYSTLIKNVGMENARGYAMANEKAIREYARLIKGRDIACDFEWKNSYLYSLRENNNLEEERKAALSVGIDVVSGGGGELPFPIKDSIGFPGQAQFSPLKFLKSIAAELSVIEHCRVLEIKEHVVFTERKVFTAETIVVATHYPIMDMPGYYFLRQHQERSYVLALSGCKKVDGMYYGVDRDGLSFRQAGEYLLLSGGVHRTGESVKNCGYGYLEKMAQQYYPDSRIEARWAAQDCMPHDGIPFIGKYSVFTPDIYVITGFQKWGMTMSMVAALILRDEICGEENPYGKVFSPQRLHVRAGFTNLMKDVFTSMKGIIKGNISEKPQCAHMGCELIWNEEENSWDCPCHGSRFTKDGEILDNPAVKEIEE